MSLNLVCIWVQTLDPYERKRGVNVDMGPNSGPISTPGQEIPPFPNTKVRQSGQSAESVFSCHLVPQGSPCYPSSPAANRATVGREEGLSGQSPPQRPICSSRRSYIPAAVLEVCSFLAGRQHFCPETVPGLSKISRPAAAGAEGVAEIQKILYFCIGRERPTKNVPRKKVRLVGGRTRSKKGTSPRK